MQEHTRVARSLSCDLTSAPFDYYSIATAVGYKKTNATVRGVYEDMRAIRRGAPVVEADDGEAKKKKNTTEFLPACLEFHGPTAGALSAESPKKISTISRK